MPQSTDTTRGSRKKNRIIALLAIAAIVLVFVSVLRDNAPANPFVSVSAGGLFTVCLRADGTVVAVGDNRYGQCDVSGWNPR